MQYNKLYQYSELTKQSANYYSGKLGVITDDETHYNVVSPVNKLVLDENYSVAGEDFVKEDTLSGESD